MKQYIKNMDDEVRCDYLVKAEMKKVWNIQLNMAVKLVEVCQKYNLRIVADSGTALGAVRHKGFIPWDDDMDFRMPREDYEKLREIAPQEFKSPFFFQTCYSDKGYFLTFAKLRYDNTTMIIDIDVNSGAKYHQGIDIDIFVDDYMPDTEIGINTLIKKKNVISNYINFRSNIPYLLLPDRLAGFIKNAMILKGKAFWSTNRLMKYIESEFKDLHGKNTNLVGMMTFMDYYKPTCVIDTCFYNDIELMPFEETKLPLFKRYDEHMTRQYGDYHKFVRGKFSHRIIMLDAESSYQNNLKKVRPSLLKMYAHGIKNIIHYILHRL